MLIWCGGFRKTPQVATAGLFIRDGNLSPYRNSVCVLVAIHIHSLPANVLKKVIFQRNGVGAAEFCLPTSFFLDNRQPLCLILVLPSSDLKLVSKTVARACGNKSLQ